MRSSIEVSGIISENTFWNTDTIKVVGNIEITQEATLTIPAGVTVEFQGFYSIDVQGSLKALGEAQNYIRFTSAQPNLFEVDYSTAGAWQGIKFLNTSYQAEPSVLEYCFIEYAKNVNNNGIGAAVSCFDYSNLKIENCYFRNNVAEYGGALGLQFNSNPRIINNIFSANYAFLAGSPLFCADSYPRLINNTITENQVLNDDVFFNNGAIYTFLSKPQIYNNIIWNNAGNFFEDNPLLFCKAFYTRYNDIDYDHPGEGNISAEPLFDFTNFFSLTSGSPCLDQGLDELPFSLTLPASDFLGNPRILNATIDLGALEWQNTEADDKVKLLQCELTNFPNPFNPSTTISFTLINQIAGDAKIEIFNLKGQKVKTLLVPQSQNYAYFVNWNGRDENNLPVSSGIYLAKLNLGNQFFSRKIILLK